MGGNPERDGTIFMGEVHTCKDFNLAVVGRPGWIKWLKNGAGKCLYFMQLFLHYILFGKKWGGWKDGGTCQHFWLLPAQLSCKIVKEFETEIWIEI